MDLEDEDATFGLKTLAGPRLEGPPRRLHLHRVRPLPGGLPGLEHRQAAQPQDLHHGHPGHVGRGRARPRPHPELADRPRDLRPRRRDAGRRPLADADRRHAIPYDAVWDCVTCGACVEACPVLIEHVDKIVGLRRNLVLEESRFPHGADGAFRAMEGQGNPWGQPAVDAARLDEAACRSRCRPSPTWPPRGRLDEPRGPVLGRLRGGVRRAQPEGRPGRRDVPARGRRPFAVLGQEESCTGDPARRMGNDYVFQMLASGNVETLNRYGMGERTIVTACPHCFNTIGNEYGQLGGDVPGRPPLDVPAELVSSRPAATLPEDADVDDRRPSARAA